MDDFIINVRKKLVRGLPVFYKLLEKGSARMPGKQKLSL